MNEKKRFDMLDWIIVAVIVVCALFAMDRADAADAPGIYKKSNCWSLECELNRTNISYRLHQDRGWYVVRLYKRGRDVTTVCDAAWEFDALVIVKYKDKRIVCPARGIK